MQNVLVGLFGMMHQYESMIRKVRMYTAGGQSFGGNAEHKRDLLDVFPSYLDLQARQIMGEEINQEEQDRMERRVQQFFRKYYPGFHEFRTQYQGESP